MFDANRFYCESDGQLPGLPEGWDSFRADWETRQVVVPFDWDEAEQKAIVADQKFARENGHHLVAAGGFVGTWPVDPEWLSDEDDRGGVRIGYPGANDPYTCSVCGSPIRHIP